MNTLTDIATTDTGSFIGTLITGVALFAFFVIISVFLAFMLGGLCSNFFGETLPKWWKIVTTPIKNFFSVDILFGNEYVYPPKRKQAIPYKRPPCAVHQLVQFKNEKFKWQMFSGIPSGDSDLIDTAIERCKSSPFHSETPASVLESWKAKGAVRVFTSINHYRCKNCLETEMHEFYTMPIKSDGRPLVEVGLTDGTYASKFKQTTRISTVAASTTNNTTTTSTRREVPVEALPYHCS